MSLPTTNHLESPGVVHRDRLVKCACGKYRWETVLPHSPRWRAGKVVDCCGREVRP
jgi:hypothetical protein